MPDPTPNPLLHATSGAWDRLLAAVNPPTLLVAIQGMMGHALRQRFDADDIWQETLLHAWRDRHTCEWRGTAAFRRWLLEIARNRIRDLADQTMARKRGSGQELRFADRDAASGSHGCDHYAGPCAQTTPGRAAADRETAQHFEQALAAVPDDRREIVRMRLFEDCTLEEIAVRLGLGVEGVRYRFRHGAEAYRRELRRRRALDPTTSSADSAR